MFYLCSTPECPRGPPGRLFDMVNCKRIARADRHPRAEGRPAGMGPDGPIPFGAGRRIEKKAERGKFLPADKVLAKRRAPGEEAKAAETGSGRSQRRP